MSPARRSVGLHFEPYDQHPDGSRWVTTEPAILGRYVAFVLGASAVASDEVLVQWGWDRETTDDDAVFSPRVPIENLTHGRIMRMSLDLVLLNIGRER